MTTGPIISTQGLTRLFGDKLAVDHLTFSVEEGEVFGFLGHNGAGKTTTIRLLNGVLDPSGGTAQVLGLSPTSDGPALRRRTGVLTETPSVDERLTARENLRIYAELYGVPRERTKSTVDELLELFELRDRADQKVGGYSSGMKRRLALARALIHDPEVLFLDEPTGALDPIAAHHVHEMITRLSKERKHTVFLCTHNLAEAQKLCGRVAVLEHGRLLAMGPPAELAAQVGLGGSIEIEVSPDSSTLALATLRNGPGLQAVLSTEGLITVQGIMRERVPDVLASLVAAGVRVYRVAPQEPSLEDIYFALHGDKGGQA